MARKLLSIRLPVFGGVPMQGGPAGHATNVDYVLDALRVTAAQG